MSNLYGTVDGAGKTTASRRGHRSLTTHAACWQGAVRVDLSYNEEGTTEYTVTIVPWRGSGGNSREISRGTLDASKAP